MAKKKLDLQSILDNPEQLADLQKKAMHKSRGISLSKTFAADPDIMKRRTATYQATLAADPEIKKRQTEKRSATLAKDPSIMKTACEKRLETFAAQPDILKRRIANYQATLAKKRELHTPYGVFAFKKDAIQAVVGRYGFSKNKGSTGQKISKLTKTNPKEWYWVKKT